MINSIARKQLLDDWKELKYKFIIINNFVLFYSYQNAKWIELIHFCNDIDNSFVFCLIPAQFKNKKSCSNCKKRIPKNILAFYKLLKLNQKIK